MENKDNTITLAVHVQQVQRTAEVFLCVVEKYGKEEGTFGNKGPFLIFHCREGSAAWNEWAALISLMQQHLVHCDFGGVEKHGPAA